VSAAPDGAVVGAMFVEVSLPAAQPTAIRSAATLQIADEKRAYTISDRATYLAWRDKIDLVPLVEGDALKIEV